MKWLSSSIAPAVLAVSALLAPHASWADLICDAEVVFNWAELIYPEHFDGKAQSQSLDPWRYRYYPAKGTYVGVQSDRGVYVLGGTFGSTPVYVGQLADFNAAAKVAGASGGLYCGDLACEAEVVFNWAEVVYPQHFGSKAQSQVLPPWRLRHYPASGTYVGVQDDRGVYVWGGVFGSTPVAVGQLGDFYTAAKAAGASGGLACGVEFTSIQLPPAQSNNTPPSGSYLGLTPILYFADKELVFGVRNTNYNDGGTIYRSDDGGVNWAMPKTLVAPIHALSFGDKVVGYAVGSRASFGVSQYVGKSTDGGKTWTDITAKMSGVNEVVAGIPRSTVIYNVAAPSIDTLFIAGRHTVYASFDGGATWKLAAGAKSRIETTPTSLYWATLSHVPGRAFIASYAELEYLDLSSGSAGEWAKLPAPWNHAAGSMLVSLAFEDSARGWALVERTSDGMLSLYETANGGANWVKVSEAQKADKVVAFPRAGNLKAFGSQLFGSAVFMLGPNATHYVVVSQDGGRTWEKNDSYNGGGWPLYLKVVEDELRAYSNVNGDYYVRRYAVVGR